MLLTFDDMINRCRVLANTPEKNDFVKAYGFEIRAAIDRITNNVETKQHQLNNETAFLDSLNSDRLVSDRCEIRDLIESYRNWLRT